MVNSTFFVVVVLHTYRYFVVRFVQCATLSVSLSLLSHSRIVWISSSRMKFQFFTFCLTEFACVHIFIYAYRKLVDAVVMPARYCIQWINFVHIYSHIQSIHSSTQHTTSSMHLISSHLIWANAFTATSYCGRLIKKIDVIMFSQNFLRLFPCVSFCLRFDNASHFMYVKIPSSSIRFCWCRVHFTHFTSAHVLNSTSVDNVRSKQSWRLQCT